MKRFKRAAFTFGLMFLGVGTNLAFADEPEIYSYETETLAQVQVLSPIRSGLATLINITEFTNKFNYENYEDYIDLLTFSNVSSLFLEEISNIIEAEPEVTFDRSRNVIGTGEYGSKMRFVSIANGRNNFTQNVILGPSGVFSVDVPLAEGINTIFIITESKEGYDVKITNLVSIIRRLPESLRESLGNRTRILSE